MSYFIKDRLRAESICHMEPYVVALWGREFSLEAFDAGSFSSLPRSLPGSDLGSELLTALHRLQSYFSHGRDLAACLHLMPSTSSLCPVAFRTTVASEDQLPFPFRKHNVFGCSGWARTPQISTESVWYPDWHSVTIFLLHKL